MFLSAQSVRTRNADSQEGIRQMNGKARTEPGNHVEWANKFKSNMPDWPTARKCAVVDDMLFMLKECRTVMLAINTTPLTLEQFHQWRISEHIDSSRFNAILDRVQQVITLAEFGPPAEPEPRYTVVHPPNAVHSPLGPQTLTSNSGKTIVQLPPLPPPPGFKK